MLDYLLLYIYLACLLIYLLIHFESHVRCTRSTLVDLDLDLVDAHRELTD